MTDAVKIEGLKELRSSLKALDKDLGKMPQKVNKKAATLVASTGRGTVRRKSGRLAGSLKPGATGAQGYVRSRLIYAPIQEFGWPRHNISPSRGLTRALDQDRPQIIALYEQELGDLLAKVNGD